MNESVSSTVRTALICACIALIFLFLSQCEARTAEAREKTKQEAVRAERASAGR
jgi:hypothetical protein